MSREFLIEASDTHVMWGRADEDGFTVRTQYPGTQELLDLNHETRRDAKKNFIGKDGNLNRHVASIPIEVYEMMYRKLGREPTARECLQWAQSRDFSKLLTVDKV